jgi:hypothetical protein
LEADPRPPTRRWPWPALLLPLAILGLYAESLLGGRILCQWGSLREFEPWRSQALPARELERNDLLLDQSLVVLPWMEFFAAELGRGELPLWNPHNYLGQPIHAANTGALLWPLHWPFFAVPERGLWAWLEALEMLLTGLGAALFLGALGLAGPPRWLGALAFTLSGFQIAWALHPHTHVSLLLPWSLLAVERLCLGASPRRTAGLALCLGLAGLGGHLQTALHVGLTAAAWALLRLGLGRPRLAPRGLAAGALAALLGAGLAAGQLLPLREYLADSRAARLFESLEVTAQVDPAVPLALLAAPDHLGRPERGDYHGPLGDNLNYSELIGGYVGRIALVLAIAGLVTCRRDPRRAALALLALAAALVAFQVEPFYGWAREVPLLRSTKLMRLSLLLAFGLSALAAFGLEALLRGRRPILGSLACAAVAAELVLFARGYNPQIPPAEAVPATAATTLLAEVAAGERILPLDSSILPANTNLLYGLSLVGGYDSIEQERSAELIGLLSSDPRGAWFIKEIRWFDRRLPLADLLGVRFVLSREPLPEPFVPLSDAGPGPRVYRYPSTLPPAFAARAVERIDDGAQRLARLGAADFDPLVALTEAPPPPGFADYDLPEPPGQVQLERRGSRTLRLSADLERPALVVLSQAFDPGWRAELAGAELPLVRVDHALAGLWLPAGQSEVGLRYAPRSVTLGLSISAATLLALIALALRGGPRSGPARSLGGRPTAAAIPALLWALCAAGALLAPACRGPRPPTRGEYEIVRGQPERRFEARFEGEKVGLALRFRAEGLGERGWTVVQNPWGQDLGLLDEHGRAWRYRPFGQEPELLGACATAEGVARILELDPQRLELVELPLGTALEAGAPTEH